MGGSERLNWMVSCWLLVLVSLVCVHLTPVSAVSLAQSQVVVSDQIATSTSGQASGNSSGSAQPLSELNNQNITANATASPIDRQKEAFTLEALNEFMDDVDIGLVGSLDSDLFENALKNQATVLEEQNKMNLEGAAVVANATSATSGTTGIQSTTQNSTLASNGSTTNGGVPQEQQQLPLSVYDLQMRAQLQDINEFLFSESEDEIVLYVKPAVVPVASKEETNVKEQTATTTPASAGTVSTKTETEQATEQSQATGKDVPKTEDTDASTKQQEGPTEADKVETSLAGKTPASNLVQKALRISEVATTTPLDRNWLQWAFSILVGGTALFVVIANLDKFWRILHPSRHVKQMTEEEFEFLAAKLQCEQVFRSQEAGSNVS